MWVIRFMGWWRGRVIGLFPDILPFLTNKYGRRILSHNPQETDGLCTRVLSLINLLLNPWHLLHLDSEWKLCKSAE